MSLCVCVCVCVCVYTRSLSTPQLPTFLLAIGNLNKKYSWPFGFGFSFFVTRIIFHAWFTIQIW